MHVITSLLSLIMENENNTNQERHTLADAVAYLKENPSAPARILVSTVTHLVPGEGFFERTRFIRNLVTQYHWNRDFKTGEDRFEAYNAVFAFANRPCYFLIDHGQSHDGDIPILWYQWTGDKLYEIPYTITYYLL